MLKESFDKAKQISAELEFIQEELRAWSEGTRAGIVEPIVVTLRMGSMVGDSYVLKRVPPAVLAYLHSACVLELSARAEALKLEFAEL